MMGMLQQPDGVLPCDKHTYDIQYILCENLTNNQLNLCHEIKREKKFK